MVRSINYTQKAYNYLKEQIDNNVILPGTHLKEIELAEKLAMSRTPIRSAMEMLEEDGYIRIEPYKGAIVSKTTLNTKAIVDRLQFVELLISELLRKMQDKDIQVDIDAIINIEHELEKCCEEDNYISYYDSKLKLFHLLASYHSNHYFRQVLLNTISDLYDIYRSRVEKHHKTFLKEQEMMSAIYPPLIEGLKKQDYATVHKYFRMWINRLILHQINY